MIRIQAGHVGALTAALGLFMGSSALAENTQWIVRYREPQNTQWQATFKTQALLPSVLKNSLSKTQVISESEGLVRLSFASEAEAQAAAAHLRSSGEVVNVVPDFLYKPAIHLQDRIVEADETAPSFLGAPLAGAALSGGEDLISSLAAVFKTPSIPAVQPAPTHVSAGADPLAAKDWAMTSIKMPALSGAPASSNFVAAVIDTGVDYNHEDLSGAMWRNPSNPQEVGYDFAHHTATPYDLVKFDVAGCMKDAACKAGISTEKFLVNPGHGTHCAGHVGAVANNALGIMGVGAPMGVKVMALKFFYDAGEANAGSGDDAAAIESIDYAIKNGARVISASWGGRMSKDDADKSELRAAIQRAKDAGVLLVIAAGNDSVDQDSDEQPSYPAAYSTEFDNIIVVAAVDQNDQIADFSNFGAKSVDIGAPGVKILSSTAATSGAKYNDVVAKFTGPDGKQHEMDWDGTSMATPIVAGAASYVWAKNPSLTYKDVKRKLLESVRKSSSLAGKTTTGGVLDVSTALSAR